MTNWTYDGFGRPLSETRPDNTATTTTYSACDLSCPPRARLMIGTATTGAGSAWVYRDSLNRELRQQHQSFGGAWVYRDTTYDNLGRVSAVSHPYYSGETVHNTTHVYDVLNRLTAVTAPGAAGSCNSPGRTTLTAYSGLTTTVTNPLCQQKTTVKNSQSQVLTATDAAGTLRYVYDPFGNLTQVTGVAGAVTAMTYDIRGRKITMNDPDMGAWSYNYNVHTQPNHSSICRTSQDQGD